MSTPRSCAIAIVGLAALAFPAQADPLAGAELDSELRGRAGLLDARTLHDGTFVAPANPGPVDSLHVQVQVKGDTSYDLLDPACTLDVYGKATGVYEGQGQMDEHGVYVGGFSSTEADWATSFGCSLGSVSLDNVSDVWIRAELEATTPNCEVYCAAKARAVAEATCGNDPSAASCRADEEASYEASCSTACVDETQRIVAKARLRGRALTHFEDNLDGAAFGRVWARLRFDHVEDAQGSTVDESGR